MEPIKEPTQNDKSVSSPIGNPGVKAVVPSASTNTQTTTATKIQGTTPLMNSTAARPAAAVASKPVLRPINSGSTMKKTTHKSNSKMITVAVVLTLLLGIGSGYGLYVTTGGGNVNPKTGLKQEAGLKREVTGSDIKVGTKVGVADERTFKDDAEGQLEKGGIDGEGSHHLVRPGGASQTLYITSSIIDLDQFVGRKVKVWGETLGAQKAGWLMDVGKLEVLE